MPDLYTVLSAVVVDNSGETEDNRPQPNTIVTASIETIDNDYIGGLLGTVSI